MIRKLIKYYLIKTGQLQTNQFDKVFVSLEIIRNTIIELIKETNVTIQLENYYD